jgi:hypothetical protein
MIHETIDLVVAGLTATTCRLKKRCVSSELALGRR